MYIYSKAYITGGKNNMKKSMKIAGITVGVLATASIVGLVITGYKIGWGPFQFLHTWDADVKEITEKYPAEDHQNGVIFYGASNFRMWTEMENDLSDYRVQNHGFGGCTDHDLVQYADKLVYPYNPDIIFFQTGSNDYVSLKGTDEEKVKECMDYKKKMFNEIHEKLPNAKLVVMSGLLLPGRSKYRPLTEKVNKELETLCNETDYLWYVDSSAMTWDGQNYREDLFIRDGIHLNHKGQLLWMKEYIRPILDELIDQYNLTEVKKGE